MDQAMCVSVCKANVERNKSTKQGHPDGATDMVNLASGHTSSTFYPSYVYNQGYRDSSMLLQHSRPNTLGNTRDGITDYPNEAFRNWGLRLTRTPMEIIEPLHHHDLEDQADPSEEILADERSQQNQRMRRLESLVLRTGTMTVPPYTFSSNQRQPNHLQKQRKGKAVALQFSDNFMDKAHAQDSKSDLDFDPSFELESMTNQSRISKTSQLGLQRKHARSSTSSDARENSITELRGSKGRHPSYPGSAGSRKSSLSLNKRRRYTISERRMDSKIIDAEWDGLNVRGDMPLDSIAAAVLSLKGNGLNNPSSKWQYAAKKVKTLLSEQDFLLYKIKLYNLRVASRRLEAELQKQGKLNNMKEEEKRKYLLERSLQRRKKAQMYEGEGLTPKEVAKMDEKLHKVEEAIVDHLEKRHFDFKTISLPRLEEAMRSFNVEKTQLNMDQSTFTSYLKTLLKMKRGFTDFEIRQMMAERRRRQNIVNVQRHRDKMAVQGMATK